MVTTESRTSETQSVPLTPTTEHAPDEPFTPLAGDGLSFENPPPSAPTPPRPAAGVPPGAPAAGKSGSNLFLPILLIGLGIIFLAGNILTLGGGTFFIGLGLVFLAARVLSGNYGLAVPSGVLLGFGGFVALTETGWLPTSPDTAAGGWFFIMLALGFAAVYVIGARPALIWPFFPAAGLAAFGLLLHGRENLASFDRFADYGRYWPLTLIAIGGYLLLRGYLPAEVRKPLALTGTIALVLYGLLVLAGGLARADFQLGDFNSFGINAPITRTEDLSAPITAGDLVRINNVSGRTVVQTGATDVVQVRATKHLWSDNQVLDIQLTPVDGVVALAATTGVDRFSPYADFVVTVPTNVRVEATSSSGVIEIRGIAGAVTATTSSGSLTISAIDGPVTARSSSGALRLSDITGELRASTSSGSIRATGIAQPREATTSSGSIALAGVFADSATIRSSSGSVTLGFAAGSAVRIEVTTVSATIRDNDITLTNRSAGTHSLTGTLGAGSGQLTVSTSSGSITLNTAR